MVLITVLSCTLSLLLDDKEFILILGPVGDNEYVSTHPHRVTLKKKNPQQNNNNNRKPMIFLIFGSTIIFTGLNLSLKRIVQLTMF